MSEIKNLDPTQAWDILQNQADAVLIDVRTAFEFAYIGHPLGAMHIPWKELPNWALNPNFVDQVASVASTKDAPVLLLCRSGQRSMDAAEALSDAGFSNPINVAEGFEGPLDASKQRGTLGGWRFHGLPWEQS